MQALWKVGTVGKKQQDIVVGSLRSRFVECVNEKNCTLIRFDILQSLQNMYDVVLDEKLRVTGMELIATETDLKYRRKYASLWRKK
jgi:hypothetical protein